MTRPLTASEHDEVEDIQCAESEESKALKASIAEAKKEMVTAFADLSAKQKAHFVENIAQQKARLAEELKKLEIHLHEAYNIPIPRHLACYSNSAAVSPEQGSSTTPVAIKALSPIKPAKTPVGSSSLNQTNMVVAIGKRKHVKENGLEMPIAGPSKRRKTVLKDAVIDLTLDDAEHFGKNNVIVFV
ncbi:hypothetical protein M422DRAFT_52336 [Sphaerobolus stellatus SS14]|uniref:Uncharacterized protein n=1 Tax=Sphaerobolus stellatus (strain SS14) TaxID=990650 RepID=A0A0C9UFY8_SPHS4|nr:hypothetical protein M422DRAFT_52336 [Sphaerobolus stellatus SS14]